MKQNQLLRLVTDTLVMAILDPNSKCSKHFSLMCNQNHPHEEAAGEVEVHHWISNVEGMYI